MVQSLKSLNPDFSKAKCAKYFGEHPKPFLKGKNDQEPSTEASKLELSGLRKCPTTSSHPQQIEDHPMPIM